MFKCKPFSVFVFVFKASYSGLFGLMPGLNLAFKGFCMYNEANESKPELPDR